MDLIFFNYQNLGSELTEEMKHLLDAFDIPYITAPYEAEAQCAYLEQVGFFYSGITSYLKFLGSDGSS